MKLRWQKQRNRALTIFEVLAVIAILVILAYIFLSALAAEKRGPSRINCISNLKQVNVSFLVWEEDNNNQYPMAVSVTNGGAMELIATGNVVACFQVMSNELSTPIILICPNDTNHIAATNFGNDFKASHISYFVGADAINEKSPQRLLSGDDNFRINGNLVGSGLLSLSTNVPLEWGPDRHGYNGNLGFADGSVEEVSDGGLQGALQQTGLATNRLAIL